MMKITRRDLLNGMAIGATGMALSPSGALASLVAAEHSAKYYPPTLTGMRGSHEGSFEVAHALAWRGEKPQNYEALEEHYDLVVVGAGMSGLAAAYFYQQKMGGKAKVLILDNHDDFGGHAKRNEFHYEGRMILSLGGAQNIENPANYSDVATRLISDLGIDQATFDLMADATPEDYTLGGKLGADVALSVKSENDRQTVGGPWLKYLHGRGDYERAIRELQIAEAEQSTLIRFFGGEQDFLDGLSLSEKYDYVNSVSYNAFLSEKVGLAEDTIPLVDVHMRILNGPSGWNHTVLEAILSGAPGLRSMGWLTNAADSVIAMFAEDLSEVRMFPDGNASVARLLVQKLIPNVAPGMKGVSDVATTRFAYEALDQPDQANRIRLNSTVVGARQTGNQVEVDFVQFGNAKRITANHCIMACYNGLIPHLCPEMSKEQKEGLSYGVKTPFVYANILLKNGKAFSGLGATIAQCPFDDFQWVSSAPTMSMSGYEPPRSTDDPMAVFMMASPTPYKAEGTARELMRLGRHTIYGTTFEEYEGQIREQLQSMLGPHGFDHETDIQAITVNRISHGYAYAYLGLDDPEWEEGKAPHELGRKQFGRISIANSDSEVRAYMDAAFDAAHRADQEQS